MIGILKKQHAMNIVGQGGKIILFMLPFLIAAILVHAYWPQVASLPRGVSFVKPVGYALLPLGLILWGSAVIQLLTGFPQGKLVTTGACWGSCSRAAMDWTREQLESLLGAQNTVMEEFTVAPAALVSSLPLSDLLVLLAALLNVSLGCFLGILRLSSATLATIFCILSILLVVLQFSLSFEIAGRLVSPEAGYGRSSEDRALVQRAEAHARVGA